MGRSPTSRSIASQTDPQEQLQRTDPLDPASKFELRTRGVTVGASGAKMGVSFPAEQGQIYRVECSTDMVT